MASADPVGLIHHLALRVTDVERAQRFYTGLLGLRERARFVEADGSLRSVWLDAGSTVLMLEGRLRGAGPEAGSGHLLSFTVDDLEGWVARLRAAEVEVLDRTGHTLFVRDPDGHRVGLSDYAFDPACAPDARTGAALSGERAALEQAQALRAATQALSATLSLRHVLSTILSELQNVVPYDSASVQQLQGDKMVIIGGQGIDLDLFLGFGFDAVRGGVPNSDVLHDRRAIVVPDILGPHGYPDFPHPDHAASGVRSWMGVPLLFGSECIGMITLDKREAGFYTDEHAQVALAFAAQAAIAIENARLYERSQRELQERRRAEEELLAANRRLHGKLAEIEELQSRLREQAIRDPLTGLFNRRYLTETLARELARGRREARPLSLVLLDVDNFKAFNDDFGHEAGDLVLQALGGLLLEETRHGDIACRYGGEEFVVVLPGAPLEAACARAETWRAALEALRLAYGERLLQATVSMGVASFPDHGRTPDALLRSADAALYEAKHQGRNRVRGAS